MTKTNNDQKTQGGIAAEPSHDIMQKMFEMRGPCNPLERHEPARRASAVAIHRDEIANCVPLIVQDGLSCAYAYMDQKFSFHRFPFHGSLIGDGSVFATDLWCLVMRHRNGAPWLSGYIEEHEEPGVQVSDERATAYISLRVSHLLDNHSAWMASPSGSGAKVTRIPVCHSVEEGWLIGPQLFFKVASTHDRVLTLEDGFTWSFPKGLADGLPQLSVEVVIEINDAFLNHQAGTS